MLHERLSEKGSLLRQKRDFQNYLRPLRELFSDPALLPHSMYLDWAKLGIFLLIVASKSRQFQVPTYKI